MTCQMDTVVPKWTSQLILQPKPQMDGQDIIFLQKAETSVMKMETRPSPLTTHTGVTPGDMNVFCGATDSEMPSKSKVAGLNNGINGLKPPQNNLCRRTKTRQTARPKGVKKLRKGKWTREEEEYALSLVDAFKAGSLQLAPKTSLRSFLAEKLNCEPMRITKKFAGNSAIGKQMFCPQTTTSNFAKKKLDVLEKQFLNRVVHAIPTKSTSVDASSTRKRKRTPPSPTEHNQLESSADESTFRPDVPDGDHQEVNLFLNFISMLHRDIKKDSSILA